MDPDMYPVTFIQIKKSLESLIYFSRNKRKVINKKGTNFLPDPISNIIVVKICFSIIQG